MDLPKIAQLTSAHPRYDIRIFHKECISLQKRGFDVHLFVADGLGNETKEGVHFIDIGFRGNRFSRFLKMPWKMWRRARKIHAEIYHFHDPELMIIGYLLRLEGFKVIYDSHEDLPRQILSKHYINPKIRKLISIIIETLENFVSKRLSAIVTATAHINDRFIKVNPRSVTINNFPLLSELEFCRVEAKNPKQICYTGGITRIRGIVEIIKAIANLDVELVLAGPMESKKLEDELKSLPGWKKTTYLGTVDRSKVYEIMSKSNLGLLLYHPEPNHIEAQPNKLFEYMAASLPVLASDFPLWRKIIQENSAGVCVNPLDVNEIRLGIQTLLNSSNLNEMGLRANNAIIQQYNWKNEESALVSLYQDLLSRQTK